MVFTVIQKAFMLEAYFRSGNKVGDDWHYSIEDCMRKFGEKFPAVPLVYKDFYDALMHSLGLFRETGSVQKKKGIRQIVEHTPQISTRHLGQQVNLSHFTCNQILRKDLGLSYCLTSVQQLLPTDYPTREEFSRWFLATITDDILNRTFFSDEAWFHLSRYVRGGQDM